MRDPLRSACVDDARHGYRMAGWLPANTRPSKPVRREIEEAMRKALRTHPGIDQPVH